MAQDDDMRDDNTQQEFNDKDRVDETQRSNGVDPADMRDEDMTNLHRDADETDTDSDM